MKKITIIAISVSIALLTVIAVKSVYLKHLEISTTASFQMAILPIPKCNDTLDNDGDGLIDYPNDTDCSSTSDDDESKGQTPNENAGTSPGGGGGGPISPPPSKMSYMKGDLNDDKKVNLIDFSIAAYWYGKTLDNSQFLTKEKRHLTGDKIINLTDFSIMAFHWTG